MLTRPELEGDVEAETTVGYWVERAVHAPKTSGRPAAQNTVEYRAAMAALIPTWFSAKRVDRVSPTQVQRALDEVLATPKASGKPRARSSVGRVRGLLVTAWRLAVAYEAADRNPASVTHT